MATPSAPPFEEDESPNNHNQSFQPLLTQPPPPTASAAVAQPEWSAAPNNSQANNYTVTGQIVPPGYQYSRKAQAGATVAQDVLPAGRSPQRPPSLPPPMYESPHASFRDRQPPPCYNAMPTFQRTNAVYQGVQQQAPQTSVIFAAPTPVLTFHAEPVGPVTPPPVIAIILGALAMICCFCLCGIPALILGCIALCNRPNTAVQRDHYNSLSTTGVVLGGIGVGLAAAIGVFIFIVYFITKSNASS